MYENIKKQLSEAVSLFKQHSIPDMLLGGFSAITPDRKYIAVTPRHLDYSSFSAVDICIISFDGAVIEGYEEPSPDFTTHLGLYLENPEMSSICHTYTTFVNAHAQSGRGIKPYGALHAYELASPVPCTRKLTPVEIENGLGSAFAAIIGETLAAEPSAGLSSVLVYNNGAYSWGGEPRVAARHALMLEYIARSAFYTELMQKDGGGSGVRMPELLLRALYERPDGENS